MKIVTFASLLVLGLLSVQAENATSATLAEGQPPFLPTPTPKLMHGFRPSIWSRTVHTLRNNRKEPPLYRNPFHIKSTEMRPIPSPVTPAPIDEETQILQSSTVATLKDFASKLVNETVAMFSSAAQGRSYSGTGAGEDLSQAQTQQLWEDKDQSYHASSYSGLDYEPPTSYHQPFHHPPPVHYYPMPQKKDDTLLTKVALIALLKLVLAKLKAIGFLKIILLVILKVPLLFFKMLIAFKGFKFLKLLSIPFLIAAFALPFLPLIPFFIFSFLPFLFLIPLGLPLLLPFLLFLPIVPVTTPPTAPTGRRRRDVPVTESVTANQTWSVLDDQWKGERQQRAFKTRSRPSSSPRMGISRFEPFLTEQHSESLLELTQRVVQSQQCMERAACELATFNDSKIYQTAIIWALSKLQTYAPSSVQRKIEQYTQAYEKGGTQRSSDYCAGRFKCIRPKLYLVQGGNSYNLV